MNNRKWGILIIVAAAILMALIIYFMFLYQYPDSTETTEETTVTTEEQPATLPSSEEVRETETTTKTTTVVDKEITSDDLARMAGSFAERFGSYSNHSNFGNITDLKIFMSKDMIEWADDFVASQKGEYSDIYYGVTTKSMSEQVNSFDDNIGEAEILVQTQRKESTGSMNNSRVYYQDILVKFVKESGAWKVNSAYWQ